MSNHRLPEDIYDREQLEEFVRWYWREIQGRPYDIRADEVVDAFFDDKKQKENL